MSEVTNNETENVSPVEQISLNDLHALVQIVDLASTRGAFRGNELTQIGTIHDRVSRFLAATQQAQQETEGEAE